MGILESVFKRPERAEKAVQGYFKTLTAYQPVFTSFEGGVYEAMQTRAAIHAFATHASKLKPEIVGSRNERLKRTLCYKPNRFMNTSQFLYRIATLYACTNNAFIVPIENEFGEISGYYPLAPNRVELVNVGGEPYLRYTFANGQRAAIEFDRAGVMTQMQMRDDIFGESNAEVVNPTLQAINMQNQGMIEGVKMGAAVRFIARLAQAYKDKTLNEERENFRKSNLSMDNNGGVLLVDAKYAEVKEIMSKPFIIDAEQMRMIDDNVNSYFGTNTDILQNKFDENTANAFYEGKIEPFAVQLGLTMTNMTFTDREIAFGNEIMFSANRLQYASTTAKLQVSQQLFDRGILSQNDVCDIWQLPHIEGGDRRFIRGEYVNSADREKNATDGGTDQNSEEQNTQMNGGNENAGQA